MYVPLNTNDVYKEKLWIVSRRFSSLTAYSILTFALIGTMISTLIIGTLIFLYSLTGIDTLTGLNEAGEPNESIGFLDCVIFGAILSSTDPVTILSIFHQVKVFINN